MCNRNHSRLVSYRICLTHTHTLARMHALSPSLSHTHSQASMLYKHKQRLVCTRTPTSMRSNRATPNKRYSERNQPNRKTHKQLEIVCDTRKENCQFRLYNFFFSAPNQPYLCQNKNTQKKNFASNGGDGAQSKSKQHQPTKRKKKKIVPYALWRPITADQNEK